MSDPFSTFNFHSYTPNTSITSPLTSAPEITPNDDPHCICAHCSNLFSFNIHHHLGDEGVITSSSRWSPTPSQLLFLEQLYRQGTKTPSAQQIQLITSQLRRFGNIQEKNVFYWFQNHKARDRQKRRRFDMQFSPPPLPSSSAAHQPEKDYQMMMRLSSRKQYYSPQHARQGLRGTGYGVKETNKLASSSNCSALAQVSDLLNRAEREACKRIQREERETEILRIKREKSQEAKCQIRDMSYSFLSNSKHRFIKSITTVHAQTSSPTNYYCYDEEQEEEVADDRTLKLFPLKRSDEDDDDKGLCVRERRKDKDKDKDKFCSFNSSMDSEITSNQFFEFLPVRN